MELQAQEDLYHQMDDYIKKRSTDLESYPLIRPQPKMMCETLRTGIRDCALHQPEWPLVPGWSQHQHCTHLLQLINHQQTRAVSSIATSSSEVLMKSSVTDSSTTQQTINPTPMVTSTTVESTVVPLSPIAPIPNPDATADAPSNPMVHAVHPSWNYVHSLCLSFGVAVGLLGYYMFWKGTIAVKKLISQWRNYASRSHSAYSVGTEFTYVASLPPALEVLPTKPIQTTSQEPSLYTVNSDDSTV